MHLVPDVLHVSVIVNTSVRKGGGPVLDIRLMVRTRILKKPTRLNIDSAQRNYPVICTKEMGKHIHCMTLNS